jgi:endonuclease G
LASTAGRYFFLKENTTMNIDHRTIARARLALNEAAHHFIRDPNVQLIDFGYPIHGGRIVDDELAIRFHVGKKLDKFALEAAAEAGYTQPIPKMIRGFQTDVPEGKFQLHGWSWWGGWQTQAEPRAARAEVMRGGISISNEYQYTFGTLGGLVRDRVTGAEMMLSNWHVLAGYWGARPGQRIYQAGTRDGGTHNDAVATLIRDGMPFNLDAAVAKLNGSRRLVNQQLELGKVRGVGKAELGMEVVKSGRKTGVTRGRVTAIAGIAPRMHYAGVERMIREVITIEPRFAYEDVSAGGDSGSWWLEANTMRAIGLHFAGSNAPERALANDMSAVLEALQVDIAI